MNEDVEKKLRTLFICFFLLVAALSCLGEQQTNRIIAEAQNAFLTNTVISISVSNEPLLYVLHRMAEQSGVEITTRDTWLAGFPVTKEINGVTLETALKNLLGRLSYGIVYGTAEDGRITNVIVDVRVATSEFGKPPGGITNVSEMEVIPPSAPGEKGVSLRDLDAMQKMRAGVPDGRLSNRALGFPFPIQDSRGKNESGANQAEPGETPRER